MLMVSGKVGAGDGVGRVLSGIRARLVQGDGSLAGGEPWLTAWTWWTRGRLPMTEPHHAPIFDTGPHPEPLTYPDEMDFLPPGARAVHIDQQDGLAGTGRVPSSAGNWR